MIKVCPQCGEVFESHYGRSGYPCGEFCCEGCWELSGQYPVGVNVVFDEDVVLLGSAVKNKMTGFPVRYWLLIRTFAGFDLHTSDEDAGQGALLCQAETWQECFQAANLELLR